MNKYLLVLLFVYARSHADTPLHDSIEHDYDYLKPLYQHLHQNPELSFVERHTAKRIAGEMRGIGFEVTENIGGYGVVSVLKNGEGPTVMIRTDMDALPIAEMTGLPYASTVEATNDAGKKVAVMHACGHDIHMTVFVGTARRLAALTEHWQGTVVMVAQPAEERLAGARAMLKDGLFTRFPRPDYILGLHVSAEFPAGTLAYVPGYAMANVDMVDVTLYGVGGHGAHPHKTKDPVVLAAQFINALQTLVSREIAPIETGVVTVGSIHGGTKHNIISDRVELELTVRSFTDESRNLLLNGIKRIAKGQAQSMGLPENKYPRVFIRDESTPAVYNHPELTTRAVTALTNNFGTDRVIVGKQVTGGEDFAEFGRVKPNIPSFFLRLGSIVPKPNNTAKLKANVIPALHSPYFAPIPKATITTGVEAMTVTALDLLQAR